MRPLSLRLMGFRSYRDETVDFRHHGLVVISGDSDQESHELLKQLGIPFKTEGA